MNAPARPTCPPTLPKAHTKYERASIFWIQSMLLHLWFHFSAVQIITWLSSTNWGERGRRKRAGHTHTLSSVTRTVLFRRKWRISSTSACCLLRRPHACHPPSFSPFRCSNLILFIPYKSAVSEVPEVEFSWQTSTEHQHRIYTFWLAYTAKLSPPVSRGWKQGVSKWEHFLD